MTFNIRNQTAGVINNVAGNQHVGVQQGHVGTDDARRAVAELREALQTVSLPPEAEAEARTHVEQVDADVKEPEPDRSRVADSLRRLTRLLSSVGAFAAAGAALIGPLQTLAAWLGELGQPIMQLLA
ncbi:MAG TPA: hypothetical protein VFZ85_18950 [Jiangellaceae bacterium]